MADDQTKFGKFLSSAGGGAAIGAAGNFLDATIGAIGANQRETQEANRQKEFMEIQQKNQMELNKQGQELAMQTWNDTNYGAQMDHILDAGLNPAMLYGKGGAGGATTNAGSGGSAQAGKAPQAKTMDIGNTVQSAAQIALLASQKKNIDADTENKMKTGNNQYEQSEMQRMKNDGYKHYGQNAQATEDSNRINKAKAEGKIKYGKWSNMDGGYNWNTEEPYPENRAERELEAETNKRVQEPQMMEEQIKLVKQNINNAVAQEKLTNEKAREVYHAIIQNYGKVGIEGAKAIIGLVGKGAPVQKAVETVTKTKYSKDTPKGMEYGTSTTTRRQN